MSGTWLRVAVVALGAILVETCLRVAAPPTVLTTFTAAVLTLASAYTIVGDIRQARAARGRMRVGWILGTCSAVCWTGMNATVIGYGVTGRVPPTAGIADLFASVSLLSICGAMVCFSTSSGPLSVRLRRAVDVAVILSALTLVAWQVALEEMVRRAPMQMLVIVLGHLGLQVVCASLAIVLLTRSRPNTDNAVRMLSIGMLCSSFASVALTYGMVMHPDRYTWGIASGFLAAGVFWVMASRATLPEIGTVEDEQMSGRLAMLPYVPVVVAFGMTAILQVRHGSLGPAQIWLLLLTAVLVLVRQALSMRTNRDLLRDVVEQRTRLAHLAFHDGLTGLPNRRLLTEHAEQHIATAQPDELTAVVLVDLDGFKQVNDSLGHAAGDRLLQVTAERLRSSTRGDGTADMVARLGGDEFVVLLPGLPDVSVADAVVDRLLTALRQPIEMHGVELDIHGSGGMAVARGAGVSLDSLLRDADAALYRAKAAGKDRVHRVDWPQALTVPPPQAIRSTAGVTA